MTDAVGWHSQIAQDFDAKYAYSAAFRERLAVWSGVIGRRMPQGASVLDAGCGSGVLAAVAAERAGTVLGFDASREMIELAQERQRLKGLGNLTLRVARLGDAAAAEGRSFDFIMCSSVLEYVDDFWGALDGLTGMLNSGGQLCVSVPNGDSLYRWAERAAFAMTGRPAYYAHVRHVPRPGDVLAGLKQRGLTVVETKYYAATPYLSPLLTALGQSRRADNLFLVVCRRD